MTTINTGLTNAIVDDRTPGIIVVDVDDGTKYEHKGLSASITVHYWVHAVNSAGHAPVASNPASATTKSEPTLGPAPRNLRGVPVIAETGIDDNGNVTAGLVNLYWNIPTGTAPGDDDLYNVEYSLNGRTGWTPLDDNPPTHGGAFGADAVSQDVHTLSTAIDDLEDVIYYKVRVGTTNRWTAAKRVKLVVDRARPDSLALGVNGPKVDAVDSLTASSAKYLTRIDLKWAFESDDFAEIDDDDDTMDRRGTPRPTGYLIDYYIVDEKDDGKILWESLQSNTGYSRGTYNHLRGLKPGEMVHYRVFSWHTNNYGIPAATMGSTQAAVSPDPVRGLRTMADGPTKIKLDWDAVTAANNGGSAITHYVIQVHADQSDRPTAGASESDEGWINAGTSMSTAFTFSGVGDDEPLDTLTAEEGAWFRVIPINSVNKGGYDDDQFDAEAAILGDLSSAEPKRGETARADVPLAPQDLTTEPAKDANSDFSQELGILLLWNATGRPGWRHGHGLRHLASGETRRRGMGRMGRRLGDDHLRRSPAHLLHRHRRA